MMIIVMLGVVLLSGFHHHDGDHTLALEQTCDMCVTLDEAGQAVLPVSLGASLTQAIQIDASADIVDSDVALSFVSSAQPRAPPFC